MLKNNKNGTYDLVSNELLNVGDTFSIGKTMDGKEIIKEINLIIEQRKERGTYNDESKRRIWGKVS